MHSSCGEDIVKCYDALHDAVSDVLEASSDVLTTPECLALLEHLETETRRLPAAGHALINQLARQGSETELGGKLSQALADRLRISRGEASRRIHEAADLGERKAVTGEPLPAYFGFLAYPVTMSLPASNLITRRTLGWEPAQPSLLADLDNGHYFSAS
jgi:hypothetical protein